MSRPGPYRLFRKIPAIPPDHHDREHSESDYCPFLDIVEFVPEVTHLCSYCVSTTPTDEVAPNGYVLVPQDATDIVFVWEPPRSNHVLTGCDTGPKHSSSQQPP